MNTLFEWIFAKVENFYCSYVVRVYERGVQLHRGEMWRVTPPGIWFKWPFDIDEIYIVDTRINTSNLPTQVVTLSDGRVIAIGTVVVWNIRPEAAEQAITEIIDPSVFDDTILGMVAEAFESGADDFTEARRSSRSTWILARYLKTLSAPATTRPAKMG